MSIKANLVISQGTDFLTEIAVVDIDGLAIDLTGYTASAYMKTEWPSPVKIPIATDIAEEAGIITLSMTHVASANVEPRDYVWACDVTLANSISRMCSGTVIVEPSLDFTTYVEPEDEE
jgi:hypothetical protein